MLYLMILLINAAKTSQRNYDKKNLKIVFLNLKYQKFVFLEFFFFFWLVFVLFNSETDVFELSKYGR